MLLIYTPRMTNRLGYTLNVLLGRLLRIEHSITTDADYFEQSTDPKLCYGPRRIGDGLFIKSTNLLFSTSIEDIETHPTQVDGQWMLFPVYGTDLDLPFDLLAATFYMVSRYEEYLPHREDEHGRFTAAQTLAAQAGFLHLPVVDQWAVMLIDRLNQRYPDMAIPPRTYRFVQTVDIDAAWCYLHKGFFRTVTGWLRDLLWRRDTDKVRRRWRVLTHREPDPFETFDYILEKQKQNQHSKLIFFALLADYDNYDKPSSYLNPHTGELLQHLDDYASMGIHPGYNSLEQPHNVDVETQRLENILHRTISKSRFHFLRMKLPLSYRILMHAGLKDDYSMGFAETIGFRAGISSPYPFYDLERDLETTLIVHPFCVMDTTMQRYLGLSPDEAIAQYAKLIESIRAVGGTFCCIVHNQNLSDLDEWSGWRHVYEQMLEIAQP